MATQLTDGGKGSRLRSPSHPLEYVAILATIVTALIHLSLGPQVMVFSQQLGSLFILNGAGYLGGLGLYLSRFWRRGLYLIATGYAVLTILAFFAFRGVTPSAFVTRGSLDELAVVAKAAEFVLAAVSIYLYTDSTT